MDQLQLTVDAGKCIHCMECIKECPGWVLRPSALKMPEIDPNIGENGCIHCQHCLAVCPTGALSVFGRNPAASEKPEPIPSPDELLNLMKNRRSCRRYLPDAIDPSIMDTLKTAMLYPPTGVNNHSLAFSFIEDPAVMEDFRKAISGYLDRELKKADSPLLRRMPRYRRQFEEHRDVILRYAPHALLVSVPVKAPCPAIDPIIALSYFELLADSFRLGTLWCGLFVMMLQLMPELMARLKIPAGYKLGYAILFGKPAVKYLRATQPAPVKIITVK